ncbi:MAG: FAD-binding oxidoreductase [Paenibacillaceae bacterium]|jgi:alkyldihydroxyacetonephosphate synthase|nr:FAD-binding oxidoreductase [Paenibacillaceae bacterium]
MEQMILTELEDAAGKENCSIREIDKIAHSVDYFWLSRMWSDRGMRMPEADYIVSPKNAAETSKVLQIANYYKIPVTTWGGGGGTQGGALPVAGGIVLNTKRMNQIEPVNTDSMYVECGTGAIYRHVEWAANEKGYATMHYPSSLNCSTVGGFLAHRGIGVVSTKYGKIDDMVLGMEVVLPNGDIIHTSPVPKHAAGPDLNQIFIGSEGTLGIMTKAQMRVYIQPEERRFRAFLFRNMTDAFRASKELLQQIKPSVMRLYDEAETASLIKKIVGVERKGAFMNIALEGVAEIVKIEEKLLLSTFSKYGAEDLGSEYGEKWWEERITFFYPGHMFDLPQMFGTMDTIATYSNIEKIYWAMKEAIETQFPMARYIAHFSHWYEWGCMIYDRFIVDHPPEDPLEAMRLHNQIWSTGVRTALAHGGVVNDHHGVGLKLGRLMKEQYGPAMQVFTGLKKQLDPNGILNPFKMGV